MRAKLEARAARMRAKYAPDPIIRTEDLFRTFEAWRRRKLPKRHGDQGIWTAKEAARLVGVDIQSLQYWECRGWAPPAVRNGRKRLYSNNQIEILRNAQTLRRAGLGTRSSILIAKSRAPILTMLQSIKVLQAAGVRLVTILDFYPKKDPSFPPA
jgi:hypothetical protein